MAPAFRSGAREPHEGDQQLLREVLTGPLIFTPDGEGYTFRAPTAVGAVIAGAVADADGVTFVKNERGRGAQ